MVHLLNIFPVSHSRKQRALPIVCLILLHIITFSSNLPANQPDLKFEHLSVEHGLSDERITCILQDSRGFMWFGTAGGLNRYDGYNFEVYKHNPDNPQSLSSDNVFSLYEDRTGVLWIGCPGVLNKFDREIEQFTHYKIDLDDSGRLPYALHEDHTGILWIGTEGGGLSRFDRATDNFFQYQHDPNDPRSLSSNAVTSIYEDRTGGLWIGTWQGLDRFDRATDNFFHYRHNPNDPRSLSSNAVTSIYEDCTGGLWIGTWQGLDRFDRATDTFFHYRHNPNDPRSLSSNAVTSIYEDCTGGLWIGTWKGLDRFDRATETFTHYQADFTEPQSLSSSQITSIYTDQAGLVWIGSRNGGLTIYNHRKENFSHYLQHKSVNLIYEDQLGTFWIGVENDGLYNFNRTTETFTHYKHDPDDPQSLSENYILSLHYEDHTGVLWVGTVWGINRFDRTTETFISYQDTPMGKGNVNVIYEDHTGMLWFGVIGNGIIRLDPETEQFTHYQNEPDNPQSLSSNHIQFIHEDQIGTLWIGATNGLNRFDRETEHFARYQNDPFNPQSLNSNDINFVYETRTGELWFGTGGTGLSKLNRDSKTFTHYQYNPDDPQSLSSNHVNSIYEDQSGGFWVASFSGLNKFDRSTETFIRYTEEDGLPSNFIGSILEDSQGNLWLTTPKGLSKFNPQMKVFKNYDGKDGLQRYIFFRPGAYHKSQDDQMFFGGENGFNAFYPEDIQDNPHIPPIVITDFQLFNKSVRVSQDSPLQRAITDTDKITLSYKQKVFSFEFASLDYTNPQKNQYAYKMKGFDKEWNEVGTRRTATYTNLPAGTYTFRVKGSNNDGVWNEEGTSIKITITPPPWKTWWAYTLYVLAVGGAIFGYVRYKTRQQAQEIARQRKELEQERLVSERLRRVDQLKDDFLANVSHELRTPLHGMIGLTESLRDGVAGKPTEKMAQNFSMIISAGRRLASLGERHPRLFQLKKHELTLQRKPLDLRTLTEVVLTVSQPLVAGKDVILKNAISPDLPPVDGDENRIQQILYNLVGNAIKFTERGGDHCVGRENTPWPPSRGEFTHPLPLPGGGTPTPAPPRSGNSKEIPPLRGARGVFSPSPSLTRASAFRRRSLRTSSPPLNKRIPQSPENTAVQDWDCR